MAYERELAVAEEAARRAGAIILGHYADAATPFEAKGDGSPVSRADLEANAAILTALGAAFPDDAILSEESPDDPARRAANRVWIVDPLDGTRDFLARTGDFAVHIALAVAGVPTVAVVYQPVGDRLYRAVAGRGAFAVAGVTTRRLRTSTRAAVGEQRVGSSRHNAPPALHAWLAENHLAAAAVALGASAKYMAIAEGALDALVTVTRGEKEWDTCAPELVVHEAGGVVSDGHGRPLAYNQAELSRADGVIASNGRCHEALVALAAPLFAEATP